VGLGLITRLAFIIGGFSEFMGITVGLDTVAPSSATCPAAAAPGLVLPLTPRETETRTVGTLAVASPSHKGRSGASPWGIEVAGGPPLDNTSTALGSPALGGNGAGGVAACGVCAVGKSDGDPPTTESSGTTDPIERIAGSGGADARLTPGEDGRRCPGAGTRGDTACCRLGPTNTLGTVELRNCIGPICWALGDTVTKGAGPTLRMPGAGCPVCRVGGWG
jgi:hypothetical protein